MAVEPRQLPSRPPFDPRPQMTPPVKPSRARMILASFLVLTGALAIIAGVAIIFWPAALVVGGITALGVGIFGLNVVEDPVEDQNGLGE